MRSNVDKFGKKSLQRFFLNLSILRLQSPIFEIRKQPKIVNLYQDKTAIPYKDYFFQVNFTDGQNGEDCNKEFDALVKTIRIGVE